jgi:DNA primase
MSEHQAEEFLFAERIVLWLDGDRAGEVMGEDVVSWLGRGREIFVVPTPPGKDPGDFTPKELAAMQPKPWSSYQRRKR